ncbi:chorismate-binding protein [Micrococcus luteus]
MPPAYGAIRAGLTPTLGPCPPRPPRPGRFHSPARRRPGARRRGARAGGTHRGDRGGRGVRARGGARGRRRSGWTRPCRTRPRPAGPWPETAWTCSARNRAARPPPARAWSGTTTRPIRTARGPTSRPRPRPGRWSARGLPLAGGLVGWLGYELGMRIWGFPALTPTRGPRSPARAVLGAPLPLRRGRPRGRGAALLRRLPRSDPPPRPGRPLAADVRRAPRRGPPRSRDAAGDARRAAPGGRRPEPGRRGGAGTWREDRAAYAEQIARCRPRCMPATPTSCADHPLDADPGLRVNPLVLFHELAAHQPAPYAALLEHGTGAAVGRVSASPERFLAGARAGQHQAIKARPPPADPAADAAAARALADDPKTRAENLMIVDLLRNDLSRVCEPALSKSPPSWRWRATRASTSSSPRSRARHGPASNPWKWCGRCSRAGR